MIDRCTITKNSSGVASRGVEFGDDSVRTEVRNSIISRNRGARDVGTVETTLPSFRSNGYNLIGMGHGTIDATFVFNQTGDEIADGNNSFIPLVRDLEENFGRTPTMFLSPGSHAYNTGNTTLK